ncbi:cysteine hydrolase [Clostridium carnis]
MRRLLVVIDYQNDFVNGALGFKKAEELEGRIYSKVKSYLNDGEKVIFTYDTHFENYLDTREGENLPIKHCIINTDGHNLYGKLNEFKNNKNTIHYKKEAFGLSPKDMLEISNELDYIPDKIELAGVVTNICVISNSIIFQSQFPNAEIFVDGDLCASFDESLHEKALEVMESLQVKVINKK